MSAPGTSPRQDLTKCRKGLHDWEENKVLNTTEGKWTCGACKREAHKRWAAGEAHPQNANYCKRGHSYTPENTKKKVRFRNGKRTVTRQCIQCEKDSQKTTRR